MPMLSRVCGVDCKPNSSNCNGYCEGRADSPETYEIKIEHLLNGAAVRHQNIDMLLLSASNEIEQLRTENAALKADNELLRSLSFRDERDALKEQVNALEDKAVILRATIKAQEHWQARVAQQTAVIEQMPVAWLHQKRTPSDVITDEVKMFLLRQYERWEFHSSVQRHSVCKAENYTIPLYLHPSTKEVEARDERIAEACAKVVIADNGQCDAHVLASRLICGEWRKHL